MKCLKCRVENESDALYCRRCGKFIKRCDTCAVTHEEDALYCYKCGKPVNSPGTYAKSPKQQTPSVATGHGSDIDSDVDFTTRVSPRRVERIPKRRGLRNAAQVAAYTFIMLILVAAMIAAFMLYQSSRAFSTEANRQVEASKVEDLQADLEEFKRVVNTNKNAERKAVLEEIRLMLAKSREEERKATNEQIKKAVAQARDEDKKIFSEEMAEAVAKAREEDRNHIITELAKTKASFNNREFSRRIEKVIALLKTRVKPRSNLHQQHADGRLRQRTRYARADPTTE